MKPVQPLVEPMDNGTTHDGTPSVNVSSMLDLDAVEVVVTFTGPIFLAFCYCSVCGMRKKYDNFFC